MFFTNTHLHPLVIDHKISLPKQIAYPFQYTPSEVSKLACVELQKYLENQTDFNGCFDQLGKMFGILVVKTTDNKLAYLAAFSGKIDEKVHLKGFVPPIFDTLNPNGFVKIEEKKLNLLNRQIEEFEQSKAYLELQKELAKSKTQQEIDIEALRTSNNKAKQLRKIRRKKAIEELSGLDLDNFNESLRKESIGLNYKLKDLKKNWLRKIINLEEKLKTFEQPLTDLKQKRRLKSAKMQERLHSSYCFLNAKGETKDLITIFNEIEFRLPAGTGECCAPKLFQYAYKNNLKPIALAEFWWGKSPSSEIKTHKKFYPCCKGKCKPVLSWMLQGLDVKPNPVKNRANINLKIQYEDQDLLVIVKPYRFLSVPGREIEDSVYTRIKLKYPESTGAIMVHRLDMGTSGLMVIAKKAEIHKDLQQQFISRSVKKRYVAILDGIVEKNQGEIKLPLRVDYNNRPRQLVCFEKGRQAITKYKVIERKNNKTKIHLYPETGRTHQLRVHCAHHLGLGKVILGDDLYGVTRDRLYLHAESLAFTHPTTGKHMDFTFDSGFEL